MSKDTPDAPDYKGAAEATAASDAAMLDKQTKANRPTQNTPFGRVTWEQDANGNWTQNVTLDDAAQRSLDDQQAVTAGRSGMALGLMDRSKDEFGKPMDWNQFNSYQNVDQDTAGVRKRAEDAIYGKATSRLDPRFSQKREQTEAQLRNQGLRPGDEAYDMQMANLGREETDAYGQASYDATIGGGGEAQRQQDMSVQGAGFNNNLRGSRVAEEMQRRGFSLNEINAILSGQQIGLPQAPGFNTAGKGQGVDYNAVAQNEYGAKMDKFNAEQAFVNSIMSGGSQMAMMFSDERLKDNIQYLFTKNGRRHYVWDWVWGGTGFGVIAQENPDIAVPHPSGFLMVDYSRI